MIIVNSDKLKEKHEKELEVHLKERKKKSNDERWTYLETEIFWILKGLEQTNISLKILGSLNDPE